MHKTLDDSGIANYDFYEHPYENAVRDNKLDTPVFICKRSAFSDTEEYYHCIFTHIAKTAGTSFNHYLRSPGSVYHNHHKPALLCKNADEEKFRKYFKFTIVRNPWDWFVSYYFYSRNRMEENFMPPDDSNDFIFRSKTFREAVLALEKVVSPHCQYKQICDEDGNILVDYIGRFENLAESFEYIGNKLGIDPNKPIPHSNKGKHRGYRDYYDAETIEIVRRVFKKDIELFGYEFDKHPGGNIIVNHREDFIARSV